MENELKRAHLYISGRVQGVNFRYYTDQQAQIHGVRGWVRNLLDGRVEAVFEGDGTSVEKMIKWCHFIIANILEGCRITILK